MIELRLDKGQLKAITDSLDRISPRKKFGIIEQAWRAIATKTEATLKEEVISGQALKVRSGRLRSSIGSSVYNDEGNITALIGSGVRQGNRVPYANIQETGGVIRPRIAKYLAIPLPAALTPAGVARKRPREYANTFVAKTGNGNLIIFQRNARKSATPLFVLKKSVTIPASHYLTITIEIMTPKAMDTLVDSIERTLEGKRI